MQPHEQRVIDERKELDTRLGSLVNFLHTDTFANLPDIDRDLLMEQSTAMMNYSRILSKRISIFKGK